VATDGDAFEEYAVLGEELLRDNRARRRIFLVAVVLTMILLGLTFALGPMNPDTIRWRLALLYLAHAVTNGALLLTHRRTHHMDFTAGYVRTFVEPKVRSLRRQHHHGDLPSPLTAAFQSSRMLGASYALLISVIVVTGIVNAMYQTLWAVGLPVLALTGVLSANWLFMSERVGSLDPPAVRGPRHRR
jgi:hypothetical protein